MATAALAHVKIRTVPEDFRVQEVATLEPSGGAFALYLLTKRSIGTLEAIEQICRRLRIPRKRVSYGGLKDRHAVAEQFITILRGPRRHISLNGVKLLYLGQAPEPMSVRHVKGNRFSIVVRGIDEQLADWMRGRLVRVETDGFPNYFGQQRFGSVGKSGEFIAKAWMKGDYERALWLALADETFSDSAREREEKRILREHWGDWQACCSLLNRSHRRSIIFYLRDHPADFRGAFARLRRDLRALYLAAYQSYLWNEVVVRYLQRHVASERLLEVRLRVGRAAYPLELPDDLRATMANLRFPLPSARIRPEGEYAELLEDVLREEGVELRELRSRHIRDVFFPRAQRAVVVFPESLASTWGSDEHNAGKLKLSLQFFLPAGSYATVLLQAITVVPQSGDPGRAAS